MEKCPWRKQVQALLEEYNLPLRVHGYVSNLNDQQRSALFAAIDSLPSEYKTVVSVLDCKQEHYRMGYRRMFPEWPRGLRKGLQEVFNVDLRTIDDWHAKALDQIAESLQLKTLSISHAKPRVRKEEGEEGYHEPRWPKPDWWDYVESDLNTIGRYGFCIKESEYKAEMRRAYEISERAKHWNYLMHGEKYVITLSEKVYLPPNPKEEREKATVLVRDVLTTLQLRDLIMDRYWDPQFNHKEHPEISVKVYAERLGVGRTRYYQLWKEALQRIAAYWQIPLKDKIYWTSDGYQEYE